MAFLAATDNDGRLVEQCVGPVEFGLIRLRVTEQHQMQRIQR